ncbi:hypothetical protein EI546_09655 [Aequorivita sp. H23M31]|uniref:RHS repeat-associated core domain-containing protein n=1 Tax=Aequorivita ciconiae TaxID=2494375 RepID=A0A410G3Z5_9FLAO|nr:hypothetical protein EI546_09655 [Aequorivita sp. H23M31]
MNEKLDFFPHSEGYVKVIPGGNYYSFQYVFQYKDHLGNIRLSYSDTDGDGSIEPRAEIIEEHNYYPFGLEIYEMDFRQYDPAIGRFTSVDPLAEKAPDWTPYRAFFNNPIRYIDPTGMLEDTYGIDDNGNIRHIDDQKYYDEQGNEVDRLYKMDSKYGVDKNGDYVESNVRDDGSSIVSDLAHSVKTKQYGTSEIGGSTFTANEYIAYADGSEKNEVNRIYDFAAKNSKVEWGLIGFNDKNGNFNYQIGTLGLGGLDGQFGLSSSPSLPRSMGQGLYSIHSHPGENGYQNRLESVYGDSSVGPHYLNNLGYKSYQIYFPSDNKTWGIDRYGRESANVKRIRF